MSPSPFECWGRFPGNQKTAEVYSCTVRCWEDYVIFVLPKIKINIVIMQAQRGVALRERERERETTSLHYFLSSRLVTMKRLTLFNLRSVQRKKTNPPSPWVTLSSFLVCLQYMYLLTTQLESQRLFFEEKLARVEKDLNEQVCNLEKWSRCTVTSNDTIIYYCACYCGEISRNRMWGGPRWKFNM